MPIVVVALLMCFALGYASYKDDQKEKLITQAIAEACTSEGGVVTPLKESHNFICVIRVKYEVVK